MLDGGRGFTQHSVRLTPALMKLGNAFLGFVFVCHAFSGFISADQNHPAQGEAHMRATIKNYLEAMKQRREELGEEDEKGFSLIELIIVVVILGILVAIAVPIFVNLQDQAEINSLRAAAANGATAAAADFAAGGTAATAGAAAASAGDAAAGITVAIDAGSTSVTTVCATATGFGTTATSGPGC